MSVVFSEKYSGECLRWVYWDGFIRMAFFRVIVHCDAWWYISPLIIS